MKKYNTGFWFLMVSIVLSSCKKETNDPSLPTVSLSATTYYKDGREETKTDRSGALNKTSYAAPVKEGATAGYRLNLGEEAPGTTIPVFGISFFFKGKSIADSLAGTYYFPLHQLQVRSTLRNEALPFMPEQLIFPTHGKLVLNYNKSTHQLNGTVEDLQFNLLPNDALGRYRITVAGSFSKVDSE